jgi:pimeloyl-ACP methyl ester carboxylesterase
MPTTRTPGGPEIYYETVGSPADPPLLMVMGFGSQLIAWPRAFSQMLAASGRFVIEFDNRDSGLSGKLDGVAVDMDAVSAAVGAGDLERARALVPYTLSDLAADGFAVLDAVGHQHAHVLGASMGAMVAQTMAIERPDRLLSLTSMFGNTGEPDYGQPTEAAMAALLSAAPTERAPYIESSAGNMLVWASRRYGDRARSEALAAQSFDRSFYPEGSERQLAAILTGGSRADGLRALAVPTLVIHGLDDTLIAPSGGERTAELVPGARLLLVEDMGHDRPEPLWPLLAEAILDHTAAVPA